MTSSTYTLNDDIVISQRQIDHWNKQLSALKTPEDILQWSIVTFPNLFQTTAFGLTGVATIHMLSTFENHPDIPLIFIDTLHHFPQTIDLLHTIEDKYYKPYDRKVNVYKPQDCEDEAQFAEKYGELLWEKDEDKYDFLVKVEPVSRAYSELNCVAVLTGRRKSQGASRSNLKFVEVDELNGIIKINPLMNWTFDKVEEYIKEHNVPCNELLQLGYKSIGDYHSTQPVASGEDERSGRWKGKAKTECGIHETSRFAKFLEESSKTQSH
ncbi:hypothetical protein KAFR_0B00460 [Kazachstania africana CBS 2517]|uniref:Phosphoadenosine phosphosulphate reductase domain-containing protein n=1 Tax=Kazachstania africana (strain ATCC 22294 / BCRC 22015 / CBS 2517 / CECT 1963 / NBRC 1671 / NRRL Y-8276) TaxID=1071382 RepID=H2APP6_KAZAF|nr:hypothetical protein KAFR_0B00460 [Kazachstania africana CBS 2517]CCF56346.1 hypothetical protein KAFR_0B00460 [Kazachstania africana CBS 2517]